MVQRNLRAWRVRRELDPGPPGIFATRAMCLKARCSVLAELRTLRLLWLKKHDLRLFFTRSVPTVESLKHKNKHLQFCLGLGSGSIARSSIPAFRAGDAGSNPARSTIQTIRFFPAFLRLVTIPFPLRFIRVLDFANLSF